MRTNSQSRQFEIDVLRGLAVLSVISVHTFQSLGFTNETNHLGQYGVELFFIISGYLMSSIYSSKQNFQVRSFAIRRFARLFPLWMIFLFFGLIISFTQINLEFLTFRFQDKDSIFMIPFIVLLGSTFTLWVSERLWNSVIPGGWSIQSEVYNYIIFAATKNIKLSRAMALPIVFNLITLVIVHFSQSGENPNSILDNISLIWLRLGIYSSFSYFVIGIISFRLASKRLTVTRTLSTINRKEFCYIALLLVSLSLTPLQFGNQIHAIIFCIGLFILARLIKPYPVVCRPLMAIGRFSYGMYFIHFYIISLFALTGMTSIFGKSHSTYFDFLVIFALAVGTSFLLARLSWKFVEFPIIKFFRVRE